MANRPFFKQIIAKLIENGVARTNILYLNFELYELRYVQTDETLASIIAEYFSKLKPQNKIYLFFDEIQEVERWEKSN